MKDTVHTNRQRFKKIQCLIDATRRLEKRCDNLTSGALCIEIESLVVLANEAEACLEAIWESHE